MTEAINARIERLIRELMDTHFDLLALMLSEAGVGRSEQIARLQDLVRVLRNHRVDETIFESGRRVPLRLDQENGVPVLRLNSEMLERVGDGEILSALARPVAELLDLSPLSVTLVLTSRDERRVRDLANRVGQRVEDDGVRATDVPLYIKYKVELLGERIGRVCTFLDSPCAFQPVHADELGEALRGRPGWPDYMDVQSLRLLKSAVDAVSASLAGSDYEDASECIVELVWDSLGLGPQSFMRHAGRTLRGQPEVDHPGQILDALAYAVLAGHGNFSTHLRDWSAYADLEAAWQDLIRYEQALFGGIPAGAEATPDVSVVVPASQSFGLDEPRELPWDLPLLCWTVREQTALRDLLVGLVRTLPGATGEHGYDLEHLHRASELALDVLGEVQSVGIQVVAVTADAVFEQTGSAARAWSATFKHLLDQFEMLEDDEKREVISSLRQAYDDLFPDAVPIWQRRFYGLEQAAADKAFVVLTTEIQKVLRLPVMFDPFLEPTSVEQTPSPTLCFPVGVSTLGGKVPFWLPLTAITSTSNGAPLRVRVVEVPLTVDEPCRWICDRALHLSKLQKQAVDLMLRAVRGDALQMAIFK